MAAVTVVFPVPPLPATKMMRRASSASRLPGAALTARRLPGRGGRLENRGGVAGGLDRAPLLLDLGRGADKERAPLDALVGRPYIDLSTQRSSAAMSTRSGSLMSGMPSSHLAANRSWLAAESGDTP